MKRSDERILTTHVGSLVRPAELLALKDKLVAGDAAAEEQLAGMVRDVVRRQVDVGIDIVNDGEYGKDNWANYILDRISGFEIREDQRRPLYWLGRDRERFAAFFAEEQPRYAHGAPTEAVVGPVEYVRPEPIRRDLANLKRALQDVGVEEGFFTTVAPGSAAFNQVNEYYPSDRDFVFAMADALREEYRAVYESGLIVQVDDAILANMYDELTFESPKRFRDWAEPRIDALNYALEGIPADRVRYHLCFGSWHVPHLSDAPLEALLDLILRVNAGAYSIEAANVRHEHEWHVWEKVKLPPGKILIPGVVTHHTTTVEHPLLVAERIVRFAKLVGRENVIAGTDCGFAQADVLRRVHPQVMWAKLETLAEGARLATKELWGR
jgi:5-methyltetrahydropteroyltriglutamate--homocysteine methyltransferase